MTFFSFTMNDGHSIGFDGFDPEHIMLGLVDPDEIGCFNGSLIELGDLDPSPSVDVPTATAPF